MEDVQYSTLLFIGRLFKYLFINFQNHILHLLLFPGLNQNNLFILQNCLLYEESFKNWISSRVN